MRAKVQYNDYKGTAAADDADGFKLKNLLKQKGVDIERYEAVGTSFFSHYSDVFTASIICFDNEEKKYVEFEFSPDIQRDDFFSLFKRFSVVITLDHTDHQEDFEISESITLSEEDDEQED